MKITIDIECSSEEARGFFGLPDVGPMQEALMSEISEAIRRRVAAMDPQAMMEMWLPTGIKGWEELRRTLWGGAANQGPGGEPGS
jgi:hypothetical protein